MKSNNLSSSDEISFKQEEIDDATKDAYLYAMGMIMIVLCVTFVHAWAFYSGQNMGMQMRIITTAAIYHKVVEYPNSMVCTIRRVYHRC